MTDDPQAQPGRIQQAIDRAAQTATSHVVRAAGEQALQRAVRNLGLDAGLVKEQKPPSSGLPWPVIAVVVVGGGILTIGLLMKLWKLALLAVFLGVAGTVSYSFLAPRFRALRASTLGKMELARAEKQKLAAAQAQHDKLDADLAALKKKADQEKTGEGG